MSLFTSCDLYILINCVHLLSKLIEAKQKEKRIKWCNLVTRLRVTEWSSSPPLCETQFLPQPHGCYKRGQLSNLCSTISQAWLTASNFFNLDEKPCTLRIRRANQSWQQSGCVQVLYETRSSSSPLSCHPQIS